MAKIDKDNYQIIKHMIAGGASNKEIASLLGMSDTTIKKVRASKDLDDYKELINKSYREMVAERDSKKLPPQSSPIVLPQHKPINGEDGYQLVRLMKEQNELLKLISNKLAFIVDELCGPVKKEG